MKKKRLLTDRKFFQQAVGFACELLPKLGFQEMDKGGGDRHERWEYVWIRHKNKRQESIGIAFLFLEKNKYSVEVWAGVSKAERFGKRIVRIYEPIEKNHLDGLKSALGVQAVVASIIIEKWPDDKLPFWYLSN